jgi:hypothetical protein
MPDKSVRFDIAADDKASPRIGNLGRSFVLLGANLAYVTRTLGIHNQMIDSAINAILLIGHAYRAVIAFQSIYIAMCKVTQAENAATAMSYRMLHAAMGPAGWVMLGAGLAIGAGAGYYAGGGFNQPSTPGATRPLEAGSNVQIVINNADFRTKQDAKDSIREMATLLQDEQRRY